MKKLVMFSLGALVSLALVGGAYAAQGQTDSGGVSGMPSSGSDVKPGSPAQPAPGPSVAPGTAGRAETIEGEVLRIEGDYYIVRDISGKEVRLHVDTNTKIDGNIAPKDKVVARASEMTAAPRSSTTPPAASTPPDSSSRSASAWHADSIKKK
jgi:uncharacterized protein YdeI (BOF family)